MIEASGLSKVFRDRRRGQVQAVEAVSFACRPGEVYGLLGANGAGKTTTLRMLATLLRPSAGTARVAGHDIQNEPGAVRARIGFLSAATALYGRLTAREQVAYFGRLHGMQDARLRDRVNELFAWLELGPEAEARCDQLSTGQRQKVSLARTLVHDPPVMIFDEPTMGLDVLAARAIMRFIQTCRARGKTVLFSSHVMSEVERLCDRVGIIHRGRLLAEGTVGDLRSEYREASLEDVFVRVVEAGT